MGLVDYSDSESENEEVKEVKPALSQSSKPKIEKVVDRTTGKIRISLPSTVATTESRPDEPPAKRARTGGGGLFSGINSFLPPPKKTGAAAAPKSLGNSASRPAFALKTGAEPAFSRQVEDNTDGGDKSGGGDGGDGLKLPPPKASGPSIPEQTPAEEVKLVGKPLMFKPLSVSRKPQKKKPSAAAIAAASAAAAPKSTASDTSAMAPKPKVSLFATSYESNEPIETASTGTYKPVLYGSAEVNDEQTSLEHFTEPAHTTAAQHTYPPPSTTDSNSLEAIASDLNLSAAERRQLFGRNGVGRTASKVINFNIDEEYRHNEEIRASGETVMHNPVRSIAPGKHSLKQLVNAAQSQKDALAESFAKGYQNRKEAGSKYGW
jgi:hypothetical protein